MAPTITQAQALAEEDREALRHIESILEDSPALVGASGEREALPSEAVALLRRGVSLLRNGAAGLSVVPVHRDLTTNEAADILNVSRPYLVRLLDEGKIPFQRVGNRRRIALSDLMAYKGERDAKRRRLLSELVAMDEEAGLYQREREEGW